MDLCCTISVTDPQIVEYIKLIVRSLNCIVNVQGQIRKTPSTVRDLRIIQNQFRFLVMGSQLLENTERFGNYCYFLKQIYSWKVSGQTMLLCRVCSLTWSWWLPSRYAEK